MWSLGGAKAAPAPPQLMVHAMIGAVQLKQQVPGPVNTKSTLPKEFHAHDILVEQATSLLLCRCDWESSKHPNQTSSTFHAIAFCRSSVLGFGCSQSQKVSRTLCARTLPFCVYGMKFPHAVYAIFIFGPLLVRTSGMSNDNNGDSSGSRCRHRLRHDGSRGAPGGRVVLLLGHHLRAGGSFSGLMRRPLTMYSMLWC